MLEGRTRSTSISPSYHQAPNATIRSSGTFGVLVVIFSPSASLSTKGPWTRRVNVRFQIRLNNALGMDVEHSKHPKTKGWRGLCWTCARFSCAGS